MGKSKSKKELAEPVSPISDDAVPTARPGTSGTENLLMTTRKQASEQYSKAQRAENAYRTRKKATLARANYNETKAHWRDCFSHFKKGVVGVFSVLRAVPYLIGEKRENRRRVAETKKRERNLELKRKLEESLANDLEAGEKGKETAAE